MIWRTYYKKLGGHVHMRIFCGVQEGALGKCGDLVMKTDEFTEFSRLRKVLAMDFRREMDPHTLAPAWRRRWSAVREADVMYLVRKRFGWFAGRVRVTMQDPRPAPIGGPERWLATFRYIWDADSFINAKCDGVNFVAVDGDYEAPKC